MCTLPLLTRGCLKLALLLTVAVLPGGSLLLLFPAFRRAFGPLKFPWTRTRATPAVVSAPAL